MPNISVGEQVPAFELPDQEGRAWNLAEQLESGPVMLVFYRGDWWPYCNGQLGSFAREYEEFEQRGVRIAGISVDPPSHSTTMVEKLELPFPLLSDAKGELGKLYGVWNDEEGVEVPAIIVVDRSGVIQYLYSGSDFADRPGDEEVFEALDNLADSGEYSQEPQVSVSSEEAEEESVRPERPAITLEQLIPYYRGVFFTTVAFKKRFGASRDKEALNEVDAYQKLTNGYSEALQETSKLKGA